MPKVLNIAAEQIAESIAQAPVSVERISAAVTRQERRTRGTMAERLDLAGEKALDDVELMLEYEVVDNKLVSKVDDKVRSTLNRYLLDLSKEASQRRRVQQESARLVINIVPETVQAVHAAKQEMRHLMGQTVDVTAQPA